MRLSYLIVLFLFSCFFVSAQSVQRFDTFDELAPIFKKQNDTTYVINFWATWCKPCVEELPYFESLHEATGSQPIKVILVSLDFPKQIESRLLPFIEKRKLKSEVVVLLDPKANSWIDRVSPEWSGAIPATVIYRNDDYHFMEHTFSSYDELKDEVVKINGNNW